MNPIVNALIGPIAGLLDKLIPDKDARERMAHEIAMTVESQLHEQSMGQLEVNKVEAAHKSLFVAGWRPFIGWSLGFAMCFNYVLAPLINWATMVFNVTITVDGVEQAVVLPVLEFEVMMPVLLGMLGLGTMRSFEKKNGVAREK